MSNFTEDDVDMLRRLFKQHMDMHGYFNLGDAAITRARAIDDLADRVELELDRAEGDHHGENFPHIVE